MKRFDPETREDLADLLGPGGRLVAAVLGVVVCAALAAPGWAGDAPADSASAPEVAPALPENRAEIAAYGLDTLATPVPPARRRAGAAQEIRQALEAERQTLAALKARLAAAPDARAALEIQREIERVKTETEVGLLRIQAKFARSQGRLEDVRRIEAEIEDVLHPQPPMAATAARRPAFGTPTATPR